MTWGHFVLPFYAIFQKNCLWNLGCPAQYRAYKLPHLRRVSAAIAHLPQLQYLSHSFIRYSTNSKWIVKLIDQLGRTMLWLSNSPVLCLPFSPMRRPAKRCSSKFSGDTACLLSSPKSWAQNIEQMEICVIKGFPISFVNSSTGWVLKEQNPFSSRLCTTPYI